MYNEDAYDFEKLKQWLKDYYKIHYKNISFDVKEKEIDYVFNDTSKVFTRHDIMKQAGKLCSQCGFCCRKQKCPDYNKKTKLCNIWNKRPNVCKYYPLGPLQLDLTLDCDFVINLFLEELNERFEKQI